MASSSGQVNAEFRARDPHFRGSDCGVVVFVCALEPRRDVDRVAHHGIIKAPPRADGADQGCGGIEAHSLRHFVSLEGGRTSIEFVQTRTAAQCGARRIARVVAVVQPVHEHRHNGVPDIFIDIAALPFDDVGHGGQIPL